MARPSLGGIHPAQLGKGYLMHRFARLTAVSTIAGLLALGMAGGTLAASGGADVGHVYVNNNTAGHNTVSAFDRNADGTLTPVAGTPFDAGGAGVGKPTGSAGAIQLSSDGRYVLAVDAASNQISVLKIKPDGSLKLVEVDSSNGSKPVSLAINGSLVYVANAGAGGSNYTGFRINAGGHLTPIAGSTFALPDDALPGQVLFSPDGRHLAGTRVGPAAGPSFIDSFSVGSDGRLTPAPGSPFPAQGVGSFGSQFRPTNSSQLFVSNAHNGPLLGTVSAFDVAADSTLTSIGASPFADNQTAPCWVAITHDGSRLFAVNTASGSISGYSIAADGSLTLAGSTTLKGTGLSSFDAGIDPTDSFLYVVDSGTAQISALAIDGTGLSELSGSPISIPGGGAPFGIVVD